MHRYHNLGPKERHILLERGTELPNSGKYENHEEEGVYLCRQCDYPLYLAEDKFSSGCGWPSFDDEIKDHVEKKVDPDGRRVEICCKRCHGHLGHVFIGEGFTRKNTRHCVNSLSLDFVSAFDERDYEKAYFAGGCFWGVEALMKPLKGVIATSCGFMGGSVVNPTYDEVCTGLTNHAETVEVIFDPRKISYETLARFFLEIHDPTQVNSQGPDIGSQYKSSIFYATKKQKECCMQLLDDLRELKYKIATKVEPMSRFYKADAYHQDYYAKTKKAPYCHFYQKKFV